MILKATTLETCDNLRANVLAEKEVDSKMLADAYLAVIEHCGRGAHCQLSKRSQRAPPFVRSQLTCGYVHVVRVANPKPNILPVKIYSLFAARVIRLIQLHAKSQYAWVSRLKLKLGHAEAVQWGQLRLKSHSLHRWMHP
jgi:hypothetical protein